jgi:hypothetical protein
MTDATTHGHSHSRSHVHEHEHAHAHGPLSPAEAGPVPALPESGRFSLIEASAGGRLSFVLPALAALWAGVYWALH